MLEDHIILQCCIRRVKIAYFQKPPSPHLLPPNRGYVGLSSEVKGVNSENISSISKSLKWFVWFNVTKTVEIIMSGI